MAAAIDPARRAGPPARQSGVLTLLLAAAAVSGACLPAADRASDGDGSVASSAVSGPTPLPSFVRPTPTPAPTFRVYTVARGDSLNSIASRFGTTARSIAYWNRETYPSLDPESPRYRPDSIQVGWRLAVIPNGVFDEQTLPEPSELVGPSPTPTLPDDADPDASDTGGTGSDPSESPSA